MKGKKDFLDSNIILYLLSSDQRKADISERLVEGGGVISVQVLNEVANVMRRKLVCDWREITDVLQTCESLLEVVSLTLSTHRSACRIAARYGFSFYDAVIVSSAMESGCHRLWTEDLQDGHKLDDGLVIRNPYA